MIVPGSQIPFVKGGDRSKATLDIIGQLKNTAGQDMAEIRQTVKLAIDDSQQVSRKNIQYTTGFTLPLGKYHLKFVVRENQTGRMGSFETDINLPDLKKFPLKLSSVVLSSQRVPQARRKRIIRLPTAASPGCRMWPMSSAPISTCTCSMRYMIPHRRLQAERPR